MPITIQVAALDHEDEKALGVMKQIQGIFEFHKFALYVFVKDQKFRRLC